MRLDVEVIAAVLFQIAQQECFVILRGTLNLEAVIETLDGALENRAVNVRAGYPDSVRGYAPGRGPGMHGHGNTVDFFAA